MKAYAVRLLTWPGLVIVYAAKSRSHAIYQSFLAANDAGYEVKWVDFRAQRLPMYDDMAVKYGELGSDDGRARSGVLATYGR